MEGERGGGVMVLFAVGKKFIGCRETSQNYFFLLGMDRIAVLPDIRPTGYPAILKTGYPVGAGYRIFQLS